MRKPTDVAGRAGESLLVISLEDNGSGLDEELENISSLSSL